MKDIQLFEQAVNEIQYLRKQNEIMKARLDVFDSMITVLTGAMNSPKREHNLSDLAPDIVYKLKKRIQEYELLQAGQRQEECKSESI